LQQEAGAGRLNWRQELVGGHRRRSPGGPLRKLRIWRYVGHGGEGEVSI
jgi:hypothetical protein